MTELQFELIQMLLNKDPNRRATAREAMEHKFVVDSKAKHQAMIDGKSSGEDEEKVGGSSTKDDANAVGFGNNKKALAKDVVERRAANMKDAEERHARGEKDAIGLSDKASATKGTDPGPKPA